MKCILASTALLLAFFSGNWQLQTAYAQQIEKSPPKEATDDGPPQIRIFQLQYGNASDLVGIVARMFPMAVVEMDNRTNVLILNANEKTLDGVDHLLKQLDQPAPERPSQKVPKLPPPTPGAGARAGGAPAFVGGGEAGGGTGFGGGGFGAFRSASDGQSKGGGGGGFGPVGLPPVADLEAAHKALREADDAAKRADQKMKEMAKLFDEHQDAFKNGQADESAKVYEEMRHTFDELRRDAEQQRRLAEDQRRAMEADARANNKGYVYQMNSGPQSAADQKIIALARAVYALTNKNPLGDIEQKELSTLQAELKASVSDQIDQQQKQQSAELKQMRERLDRLEKELSDRSQNHDSLVERRMKDLLATFNRARPARVPATLYAMPPAPPSAVPALPAIVAAPATAPAAPAAPPIDEPGAPAPVSPLINLIPNVAPQQR